MNKLTQGKKLPALQGVVMERGSRLCAQVLAALLLCGTVSVVRAEEVDPPAFGYLLHCSGCHLEDGSGDPPVIPDLRYDLLDLMGTQAGREYVLRVPGVADTPIPAGQMAELMSWMVNWLYPDNIDFKPFTAEEVTAARDNRLFDPIRYRQEVLPTLADTSAGK